MRLSLLPIPVLAALMIAAPAQGATRDDVAVAEADASEIAVWGKVVAWREGTKVVVRKADGTQRTFTTRGSAAGLTVGPNAGGRIVAVFPHCTSARACRFRRVDVASGRAAFVPGIKGRLSTPVLRRGILMWIDEAAIRSRRLAGGRVAREDLGRGPLALTGLDHDGRRFAVTGDTERDDAADGGMSEVRLGRIGRRGTKRRAGTSYSQEYQAILRPRLTPTGVEVLSDDVEVFVPGTVYERVIRFPDSGARSSKRSFGVPFTAIATGGGGTAILQSPGTEGCGVLADRPGEDVEEPTVIGATCRVVLAGAAPFSRDTRRTVPEVAFTRTATRASGRVQRRLVAPTGRTSGKQGVANVQVRLVPGSADEGFGPTGVDLTTDAQGRFTTPLAGALRTSPLGAFLVAPPRAFAPALRHPPDPESEGR
ncbi:MAG TPA: hypothetical protein VN238_14340 [Solirubrobacteraceae bacterium]|nr:hypothetical protein [Solirubrobacteraceae bacterium]